MSSHSVTLPRPHSHRRGDLRRSATDRSTEHGAVRSSSTERRRAWRASTAGSAAPVRARPRCGRRAPLDRRTRRLLHLGPAPAPLHPGGPGRPQLRAAGRRAVAARGRHLQPARRRRPGRPAHLGQAPATPSVTACRRPAGRPALGASARECLPLGGRTRRSRALTQRVGAAGRFSGRVQWAGSVNRPERRALLLRRLVDHPL